MAGLAGWLGLRHERAGNIVDGMTTALCRYDGSQSSQQTGESWALIGARPRHAPVVLTEGPVTGAIFGDIRGPRTAEAQSQALLKQLCQAYADGDSSFLGSLEGAFAIALLWPAAGRALLAADRVGIVPFYYWHQHETLAFSTQQPALYAMPGISTDIDHQALYSYLYFHAIPSPQSIYKCIRRLLPGSAIELDEGRVSKQVYWRAQYRDERSNAGVPELKPGFRGAIENAVQAEIDTDPGVGCFLSGGTDSSTVAGHLSKLGSSAARTFSIGFDEAGYDETGFARIAAKHFATQHSEYYVTPQDIVDLVPKLAGYYGAPFGNSSVIPTFYCARLAREQGIERLLGGDGGDELFGGNERYAKQKIFNVYDELPQWLKGGLLEPVFNNFPMGDKILPVHKVRRYIKQAKVPMPERMETYNLMRRFQSEGRLDPTFESSVDVEGPVRQLAEVYDQAQCSTMMNRMLAMDLKFTLADNDIPKVRGMCELAGVEVGFPFLSDEMVDFSTRVPIEMKVKRLRLRYFFKEALRDFLPKEVITKSKHGFGLPFGVWAARDPNLHALVSDSLSDFKQRGIVRASFIDQLIEESRGTDAHYVGTLVWVFMILEHWFADVHAKRQQRAA